MKRDSLELRKMGLEEEFFARRERALRERARIERRRAGKKRQIAERCGIKDEVLLEQLASLDLHDEAIPALAVLPLAEIAWADGFVDDAERRAVLQAARAAGVGETDEARRQLEAWLEHEPAPITFDLARSFVGQTCGSLAPALRDAVRDEFLDHARSVATASGGILGLGSVSASEGHVLKRVQAALTSPPPPPEAA